MIRSAYHRKILITYRAIGTLLGLKVVFDIVFLSTKWSEKSLLLSNSAVALLLTIWL